MTTKDFKKEMTVNELAVLMREGFERLENSLRLEMRTGFGKVDQRFADVDLQLCRAEKERTGLKEDLKHLKLQNNTRLEIIEDRTVVLKKTLEKELDVKVAW